MPKKTPAPATRQDLREVVRRLEGKFAALEKQVFAKLAASDQRFNERLFRLETRIMDRFDLLMETFGHDFRAANNDKIAVHNDQLQDHADRLDQLERGIGFSV